MVLTKDELLRALQDEVRIVMHLISKVDPGVLDYRPSAKQRSLLELLRLTILGPIHARGVMGGAFSIDSWRSAWQAGEATAKTLTLEQARDAIGRLPALFADVIGGASDAELRTEIEMFGRKATRGSMLVSLVLNHYAAYRMQVFLYLKAAGRPELNTLNLWAGMDAM